MKKSIWLPIALFMAGMAFYVYYGIEYNAWIENISLIFSDAVIVVLLFFALRQKEKLKKRWEDEEKGKQNQLK